jgi:hypothetical protein
LTIVVVGDGEKLYNRLKAIAPVRIVDVDGKPLSADDLHPRTGVPALDRAQIVSHSDSFQIVIQGTPNGALTAQTTVSADSVVYQEHTVIAGGMVQQGTTVHFSPADLSVTQVDQTGRVQGQPADIHLTYQAGRVQGKSTTPQPGGAQTLQIDTTVAPGTYDDNALSFILPALPLADGANLAVNVFESGKGVTQVMQIKVSDGGSLTVPAGTFPVFRLDITGGQVPTAFYITKDTPRRIVKIELLGAPFVFELVK